MGGLFILHSLFSNILFYKWKPILILFHSFLKPWPSLVSSSVTSLAALLLSPLEVPSLSWFSISYFFCLRIQTSQVQPNLTYGFNPFQYFLPKASLLATLTKMYLTNSIYSKYFHKYLILQWSNEPYIAGPPKMDRS